MTIKQNTKFGLASGSLLGLAILSGAVGCKSSTPAPAPIVNGTDPNAVPAGTDPALAANMAPAGDQTNLAPVQSSGQTTYAPAPKARVLGQRSEAPASQPSGEAYPQNESQAYNSQAPAQQQQGYYDQNQSPAYDQSVIDAGQAALDEQAVYAEQPPPPIPTYEQPELTQAGDTWTPGYWNYGSGGYYWVPGYWVAPPYAGALWTPGYWGYDHNRYRYYHGYWGRHIGYYGGVNYGFGYTGFGYTGGYWNGNNFYYNRSVNHIDSGRINNVYEHNVPVYTNNRVSYNGPGGLNVRPRPAELAVYHEQRLPAMETQRANVQQAATNRSQFFAENHGRPAVAVAAQPVNRGGFAPQQQAAIQREQQTIAVQQQQIQRNQQVQAQQQRTLQAEQQHTQQMQTQQQHNLQLQQQTQQQNLHNQQLQQQNAQAQQRNLQVQQQERNTQAEQQRNALAQHTQQLQQQNAQAQQQRNLQVQQQRNAQVQQQHQQEQRPAQTPSAQHVAPTQQPRVQPGRTTPQAQPQTRPQPQAQPGPQPRTETRPQEHTAPVPAPRTAAPAAQHSTPAAAPHGGEENHGSENHGGENHPRR